MCAFFTVEKLKVGSTINVRYVRNIFEYIKETFFHVLKQILRCVKALQSLEDNF